ncbi:MAG: O-methyltransferase [Gammaproteobacteria bacterium]
MEFLDPAIDEYVLSHSQAETGLLQHLNRETHRAVALPQMLSGHFQGRVLSMLSHMIRPKTVLEIGTYTGYSALCLVEGLQAGGKLYTIDVNKDLEPMVRHYFQQAGVSDRIEFRLGMALEVIPSIQAQFDLVFIDADKENYSSYYDCVFDRVSPGGYIIADNVLWSGKVLGDYASMDAETRSLVAYSEKIHQDPRVEHVLLPIRDGLMIARKR